MAVAKRKVQAKAKKTPAKKAAKPAAKKTGAGRKSTARVSRPQVKGVSRTVQAKPAAKKTAAKKKPIPRKTAAAAKIKTTAAQKKAAVKKPAAARAVSRTSGKPASAAKKKPAVRKPGKKAPAAPRKSMASAGAVSDRLRTLKGMLLARRDGILKEAKNEIAKYMSGDNRQLVDTAIDEGDWAVVDISEDLSLRRLDSHRQLLLDIDECLRKIQEGTYGFCEECGEEISQKRLNVIPTATLCIDCKENREKMEAFEQTTVI